MMRRYMIYNEDTDELFGPLYDDALTAAKAASQWQDSEMSCVEVEVKIINPGTRIVEAGK